MAIYRGYLIEFYTLLESVMLSIMRHMDKLYFKFAQREKGTNLPPPRIEGQWIFVDFRV
jgi:hypothetical protein